MKPFLMTLGLLGIALTSHASQVDPLSNAGDRGTGLTAALLADADGLNPPARTNTISMNGSRFHNQLALELHFVWGTSAVAFGSCEEDLNGDGVFATIQRCTDAGTHVCADRLWQWSKPTGTTSDVVWHIPNAGKDIRCQTWDTALGTGTVTVTGARSEQ